MGASVRRRHVGFYRWCFALLVSLECFLPNGYAAPRAQSAQIAGMFDPPCAAAITEFSDYLLFALLESGAVGPKFTLFGPLEERFDKIAEALQIGVGIRFRSLEWDVMYKTDGASVRFEVRSSNPGALCEELTAIPSLPLMSSEADSAITDSNGSSGANGDEDEPATLSDLVKELKIVFADELRELRRAAQEYLSELWDEVVAELRTLFPGNAPGTVGGGGGSGGGSTISLPEIDFAEIVAKFNKKGFNASIILWESENSLQSAQCEMNCLLDGSLRAELRYRTEVATGVTFTVEAYADSESSGVSLTLWGGF